MMGKRNFSDEFKREAVTRSARDSASSAARPNTTIFDYAIGGTGGRPGKVINPDGSFRLYEYNTRGRAMREVNELVPSFRLNRNMGHLRSGHLVPVGNEATVNEPARGRYSNSRAIARPANSPTNSDGGPASHHDDRVARHIPSDSCVIPHACGRAQPRFAGAR